MLPIIDFANIHPASINTNRNNNLDSKIKTLETYIASGGKTILTEEILKDIISIQSSLKRTSFYK
jgi:hypothetical protein